MTFTDGEIKNFFDKIITGTNAVDIKSIGNHIVIKNIGIGRIGGQYIALNDRKQYFHVDENFVGVDDDGTHQFNITVVPIDKKYVSLF
jgi:hypothetical protein